MKATIVVSIVGLTLAPALLGCAVGPGLSNAPALGAVPPGNNREHDAVANGRDSCERGANGSPLRGHLPPCGTERARPGEAAREEVDRTATTGVRPMASRFDFMYLRWRWARCSNVLRLGETHVSRDTAAERQFVSRGLWADGCIDWVEWRNDGVAGAGGL